ncbi:MAG TPA: META domain-containing protein [Methanoregula sp.]|nr:META domain-containing protein [Methanoregula sp.]
MPGVLLITLVILTAVLAGCTSQPTPQPVTTLPVPESTVPIVSPTISEIPSQDMVGTWILTSMAAGDDTPVITPTTTINLTIRADETITGHGGCNSYSGPYAVQGTTTLYGRSIAIGPVVSTLMYCRETSEQEGTYFRILQDASSFAIDDDHLILRTNARTYLIFQRVS